jgi:transcription antitermination factor NusG
MQSTTEAEAVWCMLLVRPGSERAVANCFRSYKIAAYWPHYYPFGRERDSKIARSLIPGYLFVHAIFDDDFWMAVNRTKDASYVVLNYSGEVAKLREEDIEAIRQIERAAHTPVRGRELHNFRTGDRVRFTDDELGRLPPGRVATSLGDGRITVEVEMMGRVVPMHVFPSQVEKA